METYKTRRILVKVSFNQKLNEQKYLEIDVQLVNGQLIDLSELLKDFVNRELIPLKSQVFYLDSHQKYLIFAGDFLQRSIKLRAQSILANNCLTLLCKKSKCSDSDQALANPVLETRKRSKERTIREVITSCRQWRRLYHQGTIIEGQLEKLTLDDAASKIGISRKTLEDYFKQLRDACLYKFDFAKHKDEKMGVLRNFVKKIVKKVEPQLEPKKSEYQVEKDTFNYIELCLAQEKEEPRLLYEEDIGLYLIAETGQIRNEDSSSSDENFSFEFEE